MAGKSSVPRNVGFSVTIYRSLVKAYPSDFRRDFGDAMVQVFQDACRRASREGSSLALLSLWAWTLADYIKSVIEENVKGGTHMTRDKFYELSGWALILSPFLFFLGFWAASRPEYSRLNFSSLPIDRIANAAGAPMAVLGILFMSLGMLGLLLRFAPGWNSASLLLGLSGLAGLVSAFGAALLAVQDSGPWWYVFMFGGMTQYLLLGSFGILNLRRKLFPRWNGLPLLAFLLPIAMLLSMGLAGSGIPEVLFASLWLLSGVAFVGLGYLLRENPQPAKLELNAA